MCNLRNFSMLSLILTKSLLFSDDLPKENFSRNNDKIFMESVVILDNNESKSIPSVCLGDKSILLGTSLKKTSEYDSEYMAGLQAFYKNIACNGTYLDFSASIEYAVDRDSKYLLDSGIVEKRFAGYGGTTVCNSCTGEGGLVYICAVGAEYNAYKDTNKSVSDFIPAVRFGIYKCCARTHGFESGLNIGAVIRSDNKDINIPSNSSRGAFSILDKIAFSMIKFDASYTHIFDTGVATTFCVLAEVKARRIGELPNGLEEEMITKIDLPYSVSAIVSLQYYL